MKIRTYIAVALAPMVNAVLFGAGAIAVLSIPALASRADIMLPNVIIAAFVLTPPIAWALAPRLRLRYWHRREARSAR